MAAKSAQPPQKRNDDEEPITERMGSQSAQVEADGDPMTAEPDDDDEDDDPITERRLQPNPALDNPTAASHTNDDPVTRERVAEDVGGRGSD